MCSHTGWYNILRLHVLDWQDKYKAYFLQLEAEKNKTQEVLNQWKSKRDAEVANIDADYLAKVANMTAGRDQYKEWYSEAEEIDKERRKKFQQMVRPHRARTARPQRDLEHDKFLSDNNLGDAVANLLII
jgi:hypothetical protein